MQPDNGSRKEVSEKDISNKKKPEMKSPWVKRAFGNMFEVRVCSAIGSTTTATVKLHSTLSPWGDNNPLVLPSVQPSDLLSSFIPFGFDIFEILLDGLGHCIKLVLPKRGEKKKEIQIQDIVKADGETLAARIVRKEEIVLPRPQGVKPIKMKVKHKLIGTTANINLVSERPRPGKSERRFSSRGKGWFCPYLYCTGRKAHIRRAQDFSIAELRGPGSLEADEDVAYRLLSESPSLLLLCDPQPSVVTKRMIILLIGISPRWTGLWSQSRKPEAARLKFHLPKSSCSALVVPVIEDAPMLAWSPYTLYDMQRSGYDLEAHCNEVKDHILGIVDTSAVDSSKRDSLELLIAQGVRLMLRAVLPVGQGEKKSVKMPNSKRAGIAMFRY
ncbi:MAG: hypothetical protein Q9195_006780 [Heterodermia aff. obscurata]